LTNLSVPALNKEESLFVVNAIIILVTPTFLKLSVSLVMFFNIESSGAAFRSRYIDSMLHMFAHLF
jgi:hypothetical protein